MSHRPVIYKLRPETLLVPVNVVVGEDTYHGFVHFYAYVGVFTNMIGRF
ncbi:MAG: hypothetical protein RLO17_22830 [Cyclobacteriaceae bacterium]